MKTITSLLSLFFVLLIVGSAASALDDKKDSKNPLPAGIAWELKPLQSTFRVTGTEYDAEARKVTWTVQTRDGYRTADFVRDITRGPFTFRFLDGDGKELATIQLTKEDFRGIPRERVMKERTRLNIVLNLPRAFPRTKKVVLQRGAAE
jgi:hypothetical protein